MPSGNDRNKADTSRYQPPAFGRLGKRVNGTVPKPKSFKGTLQRLWLYLKREQGQLLVLVIFILIDAALMLAGPYLIGLAVDTISAAGGQIDFDRLGLLLCVLLLTYVTDGVLSFAQSWLMAGVAQRAVGGLRTALFGKLQQLPIAFFDGHTHGELMSRLSNDLDNVSSAIAQSLVQFISGVIVLSGSLLMMLVLSPLLTSASLVTVPLVLLLTKTISRKTGRLFKEQQTQLGHLNAKAEESISGIPVIKAFNHEAKVIAEFRRVNQALCTVGVKAQIWSGFLMPIMNVINNIGFTVIAIVGGILAIRDVVTVGVIASFLGYSRQFVRPLNDLANIFNTLQSGVAGAERVFEILDEQEEPVDRPGAKRLENPAGHVQFENVSFAYRPGAPILKNVNFTAEPGSTVAFVGPTGAGKTTVINLLTRFYDVTGGRILLDGSDLREYTRDSLRRCFGIVLQDTYLFTGTVRDNIKYGKPDATDEQVKAAAVRAHADSFIRRLPGQYNALLTENGENISQGQKQLLAIARAILVGPSILILDEATSSIDSRTELQIQDALFDIRKDRTTFIIAHRLNTIREADIILVIDHGEVMEAGRHEALLAMQGSYYRMFNNQFKSL